MRWLHALYRLTLTPMTATYHTMELLDQHICGYRFLRPYSDPERWLAGMPCVFWDHLFQYPQEIKDMIALRREADLHARSSIVINIAEADVYIATIDDKCVPARFL